MSHSTLKYEGEREGERGSIEAKGKGEGEGEGETEVEREREREENEKERMINKILVKNWTEAPACHVAVAVEEMLRSKGVKVLFKIEDIT